MFAINFPDFQAWIGEGVGDAQRLRRVLTLLPFQTSVVLTKSNQEANEPHLSPEK